MTRPHTTHYESCGCCEAERDALKAQVERLREIVVDREWDGYAESDEAASNCVECGRYCSDGHATGCKVAAALASTPAQSLAAHDAEVRAKALREASDACLAQAREWEKDRCSQASSYVNAFRIASRAILALAESAPEVER